MAGSTSAAPTLRCALQAPAQVAAGQPVVLRFTVTNPGPAAVQMLRWNTPFEAHWMAPFVEVRRGGKALRYQGPLAKRGDPQAEHYLPLGPGESLTAEVDLTQAFDLSPRGLYRVQPRIFIADLFDARTALPPRPRDAHTGADLPCAAAEVRVAAAAPRRR